ncbi:MAG: hypothetical protein AAF078_11620 [Planctomycetota bacterium]
MIGEGRHKTTSWEDLAVRTKREVALMFNARHPHEKPITSSGVWCIERRAMEKLRRALAGEVGR